MIRNYDNGKRSIGSFIAEKIIDFSYAKNKTNLLDEINIYGMSDKDGSATLSFEWIGNSSPPSNSNDFLQFFQEIKDIVISIKKETKEQESPSLNVLGNTTRVGYRFKIWDVDGAYEQYERVLVNH